MTSQLKKLGQRLLKRRLFRVAWFVKDPQREQPPEEALTNMPDALAEALVDAVNDLPVHPRAQAVISEAIESAISRWRSHPQTAANSIVIMADPVSSISSVLVDTLQKLNETGAETGVEADANAGEESKKTESGEQNSETDLRKEVQKEPLKVTVLSWIERPADVSTIQHQIKDKLNLSADGLSNDSSSNLSDEEDLDQQSTHQQAAHQQANKAVVQPSKSSAQTPSDTRTLMVIPNLCWCFLRSADGLDGLDYLQDLLPRDRNQFWVLGSGVVGWEYLKSTLKFHAYCGSIVTMPALSGEDLQSWLSPIAKRFEIHFPEAGFHKRLQNGDHLLLELDVDIGKPIEAVSEISQEITASVQSSVRSLKKQLQPDESKQVENSPQEIYFERLADISDGIAEVAVQMFIKSLRYYKVKLKSDSKDSEAEESETKVVLNQESESEAKETKKEKDTEKESQLVATPPQLPQLPELSQDDLYLLYSLMLHGDMTIIALSKSLGDSPNVVNNQVQMLRNVGIVEQQASTLKINPVHYPKLRRELSRNNFMIEVP